jgi:hypothetical protein
MEIKCSELSSSAGGICALWRGIYACAEGDLRTLGIFVLKSGNILEAGSTCPWSR